MRWRGSGGGCGCLGGVERRLREVGKVQGPPLEGLIPSEALDAPLHVLHQPRRRAALPPSSCQRGHNGRRLHQARAALARRLVAGHVLDHLVCGKRHGPSWRCDWHGGPRWRHWWRHRWLWRWRWAEAAVDQQLVECRLAALEQCYAFDPVYDHHGHQTLQRLLGHVQRHQRVGHMQLPPLRTTLLASAVRRLWAATLPLSLCGSGVLVWWRG
mmetsp:Transcript_18438/g.52681  ORF Transcript_18438/g.52681 Transcript_18438/m.52681 type:complete len:213 (-) Transcript_18438:300-938(-)